MFDLFIDNRVFSDIQNAVDYYNSITPGLGKKFEKAFEKELNVLGQIHFTRSDTRM